MTEPIHGRGAWSVSGKGGTLKVNGAEAGPYYTLSIPGVPKVGTMTGDINARAVKAGVLAIQNALIRRQLPLLASGVFDQSTKTAVTAFQRQHMPGESDWGGVGPETSKALFLHDVRVRSFTAGFDDWRAVCGIIASESSYDPGAVGYTDPSDLGLAQINGRAHPDMSEAERLRPIPSIQFVATYLRNALATFSGNERDAVLSYNLGAGGTRTWIKAGRPNPWTPPGSTTPRDVEKYIDDILSACA